MLHPVNPGSSVARMGHTSLSGNLDLTNDPMCFFATVAPLQFAYGFAPSLLGTLLRSG